MMEKQKKIELLQKIAHRLNEAHVQWALGASMLLYFKGITSEFHDIDLLVSEHDAECVRRILSEMGELCPPDPMPESHVPDKGLYGVPHRFYRGRCHGWLCDRARGNGL